MPRLTTAEATVETLLRHGLDTVYALPGLHNDLLFDAFYHAGDRLRVIHPRHEQTAAYMALGAALATGQPQAFAVVPGPGLLNAGSARSQHCCGAALEHGLWISAPGRVALWAMAHDSTRIKRG